MRQTIRSPKIGLNPAWPEYAVNTMLLCTKRGFYSIVKKASGEFHIRARMKRDLENLKRLAEIKKAIVLTRNADYRYRIVANQIEVIAALGSLATEIDYFNFNDLIGADPEQCKKLDAYHEISSAMRQLQKKDDSSKSTP